MFPWLWFWAPHVEFPLSGNVMQDIEPNTHWFFAGIKPQAGHAQVEERAFNVATYGHQLGLITEVLLDVAQKTLPVGTESAKALAELQRVQAEIEQIKVAEYAAEIDTLQAQVEQVLRSGGRRAEKLLAQLQPVLARQASEAGSAPLA